MNVNLLLAVLDTEEKKYREAEARYRQLYQLGEKDPRPLEGSIQVYMAENQPEKALALLEQEIKQNPDSRPAHLLLASTAIRTGKLDLAAQQYEWLRSKDPNSVQVYASLGDLYQLKGDINSALDSYQKARDLAPNNPGIIAMIAFLQDTSGKEVEAIGTLQKQLAMDPENTIAMNNLAFALADTSTDLDKALRLAQSAQRKAPSNPGIADTVGWVYVKKGLNDSAIQIFNGLVKKYPDEPAFRYHLGVALLQKGESAEAKAEFEISLSKNPPKDIAEKIKQILSKLG
jgi:Flp pilus assembly protein TadD